MFKTFAAEENVRVSDLSLLHPCAKLHIPSAWRHLKALSFIHWQMWCPWSPLTHKLRVTKLYQSPAPLPQRALAHGGDSLSGCKTRWCCCMFARACDCMLAALCVWSDLFWSSSRFSKKPVRTCVSSVAGWASLWAGYSSVIPLKWEKRLF